MATTSGHDTTSPALYKTEVNIMRGFTTTLTRQVTFEVGDEAITYTLHPLPVLFMPMMRMVFSEADGLSKAELDMIYERRALAMVAEGLRPSESDIPAHPDPCAGLEAWTAYVDDLALMFRRAGLTMLMLNRLSVALHQIERDTGERLEQLGND